MANHHHHLLSIFIALTIITIISAAGITIDLIDRDSPHSPLYSNSTSDVDKLYDSFQRSILRARELVRRATRAASPSSIIFNAPVYPGSGDYLVDLSIGTPQRRFLAILDTGSDLSWTQCAPCEQCFYQSLPIFDPSQSTSYGHLTCDSATCQTLPPYHRSCNAAGNTCTYMMGYGDGSTTVGDLATETLILEYRPGSPRARVTNLAFGCGHRNQGLFSLPETGLFGLGQGPLSFPSQTKDSPYFGGKFAYCLLPKRGGGFNEDVRSKLSFGDDAVVSGDGALTTPMASGPVDTFYYLTLKGVSVGEKKTRIPFNSAKRNGSGSGPGKYVEGGNMFIDSGTTLTLLPADMFDKLLLELKLQIKAATITDPRGALQLCYQGEIEAPYITFHFTGVDMALPMQNTFIPVMRDVVCLAMLPTAWGHQHGVLGNVAQADFVVAHDLVAKTISFKATDCKSYVP